MNIMEMQVNKEKVYINITDDAYDAFEYMRGFKELKARARVAVKDNEKNGEPYNGICTWCFISSYLDNPIYVLRRMGKRVFLVERVEE